MARALKILPLAREDLKAIYEYGLQFGQKSAVDFLAKLENAFENLRLFDIGSSCFELRPDLYRHSVGNYVIFFLRSEGEVTVVRVLHGSQERAGKL